MTILNPKTFEDATELYTYLPADSYIINVSFHFFAFSNILSVIFWNRAPELFKPNSITLNWNVWYL